MGYIPPVKIFLTDDKGVKMSVKQSVDVINRDKIFKVTEQQLRHHISQNDAETIQDIYDIKERIKTQGKMCNMKRNVHMTKYGPLSLREMHERHEFRDQIKRTAISGRIQLYGAMSDKIWDAPVALKADDRNKKTKRCKCCLVARKVRFFKKTMAKKSRDGLQEICQKCLDDPEIDTTCSVKQKKKKRILTVAVGKLVRSKGKLYKVVKCFKNGGGVKADLTCHRVMEDNGQVLKRKNYLITGGWTIG